MTTEQRMHSKILGVTMAEDIGEHRQENISKLKDGQKLYIKHEFDNPFDANALKVFGDEAQTMPIGYLRRELAKDLQDQKARGWQYEYFVEQVTGGGKGKSFGVNILIVATHE